MKRIVTFIIVFLISGTVFSAGETTALQAFIDTQAGIISTLTTRVTTAEATVAAQVTTISALNTRLTTAETTITSHEKRITALEAWVKAYVPPVTSINGMQFTILGTCSTRGCTTIPLGIASTSTVKLGTPSTFIGPLGTVSTFNGILGTLPNPLSPHP